MTPEASPSRGSSMRLRIPADAAGNLMGLTDPQVNSVTSWYCGLDHRKSVTRQEAEEAARQMGVSLDTLGVAFPVINTVVLALHRGETTEEEVRADLEASSVPAEAVAIIERLVAGCKGAAEELNKGARSREYSAAGAAPVRSVEIVCDLRAVLDEDVEDDLVGLRPETEPAEVAWIPSVLMAVDLGSGPPVCFQFTEEEFRNLADRMQRVAKRLDAIAQRRED